jgi:hydroxylation protein CepL
MSNTPAGAAEDCGQDESPGRLDLGDPATYDAGPPFGVWAGMRAGHPVQHSWSACLGTGFWSVTGWAPIRAALSDDKTFVSGYGMFLGFGPDSPDPASQRMLVVTDGPHRRALRGVMQGFFTPGWARACAERMAEIFRSTLEPRLGDPDLDFAQEIAWQVPMAAVCQVLDIPDEDQPQLGELTNGVLVAQDPHVDQLTAAAQASSARSSIVTYFRDLAARRRRAPGDDIVSALVGSVEDKPLPPGDVLLNLLSILVAGNETTRLALAGAVVAFAEHPAEWARLCADPSLVKRATDEILRWTSPALHISRTAAVPADLAGVHVDAGDVVTLWLPAGNRDPAAFPDPGTFDIARTGSSPVTFGHGPHHCIGAALARVEIAALLTALPALVSGIEIAGPLERTHSNTLTGYARVPVLLRAA